MFCACFLPPSARPDLSHEICAWALTQILCSKDFHDPEYSWFAESPFFPPPPFEKSKQNLNKNKIIKKIEIELKEYIDFIEKEVEVPIKIVSVGPDRKQTITK